MSTAAESLSPTLSPDIVAGTTAMSADEVAAILQAEGLAVSGAWLQSMVEGSRIAIAFRRIASGSGR